MKPRLRFSPDAFVRRMQMSPNTVWGFAEGRLDRYVLALLCRLALESPAISYIIATAQELPVSQPGKNGLLEWFGVLQAKGALCSEFKGKRTVAIFLADKDIDDLLDAMIQSSHLLYTRGYSIENHLFADGDLSEAIATITSLDPSHVRATLGDQGDWCRRAADAWVEWVGLCIFVRRHKIDGAINYGRPSQIHAGPYGPLDSAKYDEFVNTLVTASGLEGPLLLERLSAETQTVSGLYADGRHHEVFKGKWFVEFAVVDAKAIAGEAPMTAVSGDYLCQFLAATPAFRASDWATTTVTQIASLLSCQTTLGATIQ